MGLIDTHAHIYDKAFTEDFQEVIERAKSNGVRQILMPNIDEESIQLMKQLHGQEPSFFTPMIGIHPCYIKENWEEQIALVHQELEQEHNYCAVGEIGIDLYWDKTLVEQQKKAFAAQIDLAKKYQLPIAIHARESFDEIFEIIDLKNDDNLTGVFHCFTGNIDQANHILSYGGFKLGLGGVLTFKNSGLDKVVEQIDLQHLVLETDAPYLAPTPNRGKRNEPSFVKLVGEKLSDIYQIPMSEIEEVTSENAKKLFNL